MSNSLSVVGGESGVVFGGGAITEGHKEKHSKQQ